MLPASAVPPIVSVVSFERPLFATAPVTGATSSLTLTITGAAGPVASSTLSVVPLTTMLVAETLTRSTIAPFAIPESFVVWV